MNKMNDMFQVDYLPDEKKIKINLPEEAWKNINTIIMTRLFQEELVVEKQMAISANNGWIPISERLPKENEEVLITLTYGKVTWAYLHQGEWYNMFSTYPIERVIAWMPLPKPFKEDVE